MPFVVLYLFCLYIYLFCNQIKQQAVQNKAYLMISGEGGGTISTVVPRTIFQTILSNFRIAKRRISIYAKVFINVFINSSALKPFIQKKSIQDNDDRTSSRLSRASKYCDKIMSLFDRTADRSSRPRD